MSDPALAGIRDRYLDLLVKAVTHTLYGVTATVEMPEELIGDVKILTEVDWTAEEFQRAAEEARIDGRDWPQYAQTMVGVKRLENVRRCVETVIAEDIDGDLIEAGVWRGGVGILMRGVLAAYGSPRHVWLADSFQGLPPPDEAFPEDSESQAHRWDQLSVSLDEVRASFERYALLDEQVHFVEGWFRDTLPQLRGRQWALVRLDGDMYESTLQGLENLYDDLSPGGFLIVDDYGALEPCQRAVDEFRAGRGIDAPMVEVDWTGVYWRKP
jgi:O-methyltransferase